MLIRLHKLASRLGRAEFVEQTREGESQVQTDAQAAPHVMEGLIGPSYKVGVPGFREPGGF